MIHTLSLGQFGLRRVGSAAPAATYSGFNPSDKAANTTLSGGNLTASNGGAGPCWVRSVTSKNSGKWYFEFFINNYAVLALGFATSGSIGTFLGNTSGGFGVFGNYPGLKAWNNNSEPGTFGTDYATSSVVGVHLDIDAGQAWVSLTNSTINGGNPATATSPLYTFAAGTTLFAAVDVYNTNAQVTFRPDPSTHTYSPAAGFTAGWPV